MDSKSAVCMDENGKDTKHTRHIARKVHLIRNVKNSKMHKVEWCEGGLQVVDIATKIFSDHESTPRMKYIMLRIDN